MTQPVLDAIAWILLGALLGTAATQWGYGKMFRDLLDICKSYDQMLRELLNEKRS